MTDGYLRIGEFSDRVGVSPERLRAWEKRYGLLTPSRSQGRFRLYSDADVARVRRMVEHLDRGISAAEAARLARRADASGGLPPAAPVAVEPQRLEAWRLRLRERLEALDDAGAHEVLDELLATFATETVLRDVVLPCLAELGRRWADGQITVAQEHFASHLLRGRLLGLGRGWGRGAGTHAVLACPPGELHDLGLVVCGVALHRQGIRVVFLGADCPTDTLLQTVRGTRPSVLLLAATETGAFEAVDADLRALAAEVPLHLAGPGASAALAQRLGAAHVADDPVTAAATLAAQALDGMR